MKLSDLHCDTPFELFKHGSSLYNGDTAFTLEKCIAANITDVVQVMAFWSDPGKSPDECYSHFFAMFDNLTREIELCARFPDAPIPLIIPSVEGARLLGNDLARLAVLKEYGVKILTPVWQGLEVCGGAYDCDEGLSDFGKQVIRECERLGITVDVSHMSEKSFWDTVNISSKPLVATHSNSAVLCNHPRNLSDTQARMIAESGGVVGVSVCAKHILKKYSDTLPTDGDLFIKEFCDHIVHYLSLGSVFEKAVCLGCDFDGTQTGEGIKDISCMEKVENELHQRGLKKQTIDGVMWKNAMDFLGV